METCSVQLLRFGPPGDEKPGMLDRLGELRDLSCVLSEINGAALAPASIERLRRVDPETLPRVEGRPRLGPPLVGIGNILAIGVNYRGHAGFVQLPREPIIFSKHTGALSGPNDPVLIPPGAGKVDWEVELVVVIGLRARRTPVERALEHVAGYMVGNDVSERDFQSDQRCGQIIKGKSWESFCPLGPWLATTDEIPDPGDLRLWLDVNGERMQDCSTSDMLFSVPELVSYVSHFMVLLPGDVILTGTPPGVGMASGRYLKPGDEVRLGIDGLGEQHQKVIAQQD